MALTSGKRSKRQVSRGKKTCFAEDKPEKLKKPKKHAALKNSMTQ